MGSGRPRGRRGHLLDILNFLSTVARIFWPILLAAGGGGMHPMSARSGVRKGQGRRVRNGGKNGEKRACVCVGHDSGIS